MLVWLEQDHQASSCFTVNVGIVLPFAVDLGMQPNEVTGKLAQGQLLKIADLDLTVKFPVFKLHFQRNVSLTENNDVSYQ